VRAAITRVNPQPPLLIVTEASGSRHALLNLKPMTGSQKPLKIKPSREPIINRRRQPPRTLHTIIHIHIHSDRPRLRHPSLLTSDPSPHKTLQDKTSTQTKVSTPLLKQTPNIRIHPETSMHTHPNTFTELCHLSNTLTLPACKADPRVPVEIEGGQRCSLCFPPKEGAALNHVEVGLHDWPHLTDITVYAVRAIDRVQQTWLRDRLSATLWRFSYAAHLLGLLGCVHFLVFSS